MRTDSDRAVSSVVGVVLLLGITIIGSGVVVGLGAQAFADAERTATVSQAEHSLTQFDSNAAIVALGESSSQRVDLGGSGDGTFVADNDSGWMRIVHHNATGADENEVIYNATMGAVSYRNGDVEVGYQGGGVWERRGNDSVMRSPPEFNYRGATLTLPSVRVTTADRASGQTTAIIRQSEDSRQVFPNATAVDGDEDWADEGAPYGDGQVYENPVTSGNVTVTVQSRFYQGWAEFFRTRTAGVVSVDHDKNQASVKLVTSDTVGRFDLGNAMDEDGITARGQAEGHSLTDFNVTFRTEGHGNDFNNFHGGFYAESGEHRFEYVVHVPSGNDPEHLKLSIFYKNTSSGVQHEWSNDTIDADSGPVRLEDSGGDTQLVVNLTAGSVTDGLNLTYQDTSAGESYYDWSGSRNETATFSHVDEDGETTTFEEGDSTTTYHLSRHYVALLGDEFTLNARGNTGGGGGGSHVDPDSSGGTLDYETGDSGTYITYLHVTENRIEVELK